MRKTIASFALGLLLGAAGSVSAEWDWGDYEVLKNLNATASRIDQNLGRIHQELKRANDMAAAGCPLERKVGK